MAQQVKVILVDDVEGGPAVETVTFSLDGTSYEIDLNERNAATLRDVVAPYVAAGRRAGRSSSSRSSGDRRTSRRAAGSDRDGRAADIRAWARTQSIKVNERGRIPARVVEQYDAAH